jgi:uncharacterized membrane protein
MGTRRPGPSRVGIELPTNGLNQLGQKRGEAGEWASTRSAIETTVWEEMKSIKWTSKDVALAALLAALYAAYVFYFAVTSFGPLQVRVVDALLPLSILLGFPAVIGVTIGCFIGNWLGSPIGIVDIIGGPVANFVAATLALAVTRRKFRGGWLVAIALEIVAVTVIVGSYLVAWAAAPGVPLWVGWVEFLGSEVVAIGVLGYPLLRAVARAMRVNPAMKPENPS